jgi:ABC-type polysaccharide/polyol phosphate export permease
VLLGLALFSEGVGLLLSTTNARYGDVEYMVGVALGALYFLTPVLYPVSAVPAGNGLLRFLVEWQPVSRYVQALHDSLYLLSGPGIAETATLVVFGAAVFAVGLWVFDRTTEDVGELL